MHHLRKGTTNCGPSVERPEPMEVEAHFTFKTPHTTNWNPEPSQSFLPRLFSSEDENPRDWDSQHLPLKDKQSPQDPQEAVVILEVSKPLGGGA